MKKLLFIFCISLLWQHALAQITTANPIISVGILGDRTIKTLDLRCNSGRYFLLGNKGDTLQILTPGDKTNFGVKDWNITLKTDTGILAQPAFTLQALDSSASFELIAPSVKVLLIYDGSLRLTANGGKIKLINKVPLESYVDDVLRAEVGKDHPLELYKVQAVISRTYTLDNLNKHKAEFYNVCDKVHCQVYNGKGKFNTLIDSATAITRGEIITYNNKPITAAFHANCGGQTVNSEDVWNHPLPYLRAVTDSFCIYSSGAYWEKKVPITEWLRANGVNQTLTAIDSATLCFNQPSRLINYPLCKKQLPLKQVRLDNKLRSTYFSTYTIGNDIILCGRGYGHGVGMCQEGSSAMAKKGFDYKQIINFYFKGVNIVPITTILPK